MIARFRSFNNFLCVMKKTWSEYNKFPPWHSRRKVIKWLIFIKLYVHYDALFRRCFRLNFKQARDVFPETYRRESWVDSTLESGSLQIYRIIVLILIENSAKENINKTFSIRQKLFVGARKADLKPTVWNRELNSQNRQSKIACQLVIIMLMLQ